MLIGSEKRCVHEKLGNNHKWWMARCYQSIAFFSCNLFSPVFSQIFFISLILEEWFRVDTIMFICWFIVEVKQLVSILSYGHFNKNEFNVMRSLNCFTGAVMMSETVQWHCQCSASSICWIDEKVLG